MLAEIIETSIDKRLINISRVYEQNLAVSEL